MEEVFYEVPMESGFYKEAVAEVQNQSTISNILANIELKYNLNNLVYGCAELCEVGVVNKNRPPTFDNLTMTAVKGDAYTEWNIFKRTNPHLFKEFNVREYITSAGTLLCGIEVIVSVGSGRERVFVKISQNDSRIDRCGYSIIDDILWWEVGRDTYENVKRTPHLRAY